MRMYAAGNKCKKNYLFFGFIFFLYFKNMCFEMNFLCEQSASYCIFLLWLL